MTLQTMHSDRVKPEINVKLGNWVELQAEAKVIRTQVFVVEQHIDPEIEMDAMDAHCIHAIAYNDDNEPVGTGRLLPDGHIGRMAVLSEYRSAGIGAAILRSLMSFAKLRGQAAVQLNSQTSAENFYLRNGFVREGDEFQEAGIAHIHMARGL